MEENTKNLIENQFELSIVNKSISVINDDIIEYGIDEMISDDVLKGIPIVDFFNAIYKVGKSINNAIFTKKILKFLYELKRIDTLKRQEIISKINNDKKYSRKVGETLIMIIDKIDDLIKPHIIGKLFNATIREKITYEKFLYLSHIVNNTYIDHLLKLKEEKHIEFLCDWEKESLKVSGILFQSDIKRTHRYLTRNARRVVGGTSDPLKVMVDSLELKISDDAQLIFEFGFSE